MVCRARVCCPPHSCFCERNQRHRVRFLRSRLEILLQVGHLRFRELLDRKGSWMAGVGAHPRLPGREFKPTPLAPPPPPQKQPRVRPHLHPVHRGAAPPEPALGHGESALRQVLRECSQLSGPAACLLGASAAAAFGWAREGKSFVEIGCEDGATFPGQERIA